MKLDILEMERFNAADYFLDRHIREGRENKIAVVCEDRKLTYKDLSKEANRFGNALLSSGICMENRVALLMLDMELYPAAFLGAIKMGAVPICFISLMTVVPGSWLWMNLCMPTLKGLHQTSCFWKKLLW